jgi:hypothetical protein
MPTHRHPHNRYSDYVLAFCHSHGEETALRCSVMSMVTRDEDTSFAQRHRAEFHLLSAAG